MASRDARADREANDELREENRQLRERLRPDTSISYPGLGLTQGDLAFLECLVQAKGITSTDWLANRLGCTRNSLKVRICRIRKKLRPCDPAIKILTASHGQVYIPDEHKQRLATMAVKGK